jgi:hypothetical protein
MFMVLHSMHKLVWSIYRKNSPILTLKPDELIYDIYPTSFVFIPSFLSIKQDTSKAVFWSDIQSITIEKRRLRRVERQFLVITLRTYITILIEPEDIDSSLRLLCLICKPYKPIKVIDGGFRLSRLYAAIYPYKHVIWITILLGFWLLRMSDILP